MTARSKNDRLTIERRGGLGGFGLPGSRIRSAGEVLLGKLSAADRRIVDELFAVAGTLKRAAAAKAAAPPVPKPDGFVYCLTRTVDGRPRTIEVSEDRVPAAVRNAVKETLA